MFFNKN